MFNALFFPLLYLLPAAPQLFQVKVSHSTDIDMASSPSAHGDAHGDGTGSALVAEPVAPAPAPPTRPRAKAAPRTHPNASVISLIHRDDPSVRGPFDTSLKATQLPWGKTDCKDFSRIFGELKAEYKDMAKSGATRVNFFRPVSLGLGSGAFYI